ncbi:Vasculin-like protein 1, partial [Dissostichus eleginoides]
QQLQPPAGARGKPRRRKSSVGGERAGGRLRSAGQQRGRLLRHLSVRLGVWT